MSASSILNSHLSSACAERAVQAPPRLLPVGATRRLRAVLPMRLRVVSGRAWVTLGAGMQGWRELSGDVVLGPGQGMTVAWGQRAVVEPLGGEPLRYRWERVSRSCR